MRRIQHCAQEFLSCAATTCIPSAHLSLLSILLYQFRFLWAKIWIEYLVVLLWRIRLAIKECIILPEPRESKLRSSRSPLAFVQLTLKLTTDHLLLRLPARRSFTLRCSWALSDLLNKFLVWVELAAAAAVAVSHSSRFERNWHVAALSFEADRNG